MLIHGDATLELDKLIEQGIQVDTIITDPPYGVNFQAHYDDSKEYVFGNINKWYSQFYTLLKDKSHMFVFVPIKEIHKWIQAGIDAGFDFKNILSTKAHFIGGTFKPKNGFSYEFQPILHFTKNGAREFNKYNFVKTSKSWFKDKRNTNPQEFTYIYTNYIDKEWAFANTKSTSANSKHTDRHPNEKNITLLKFLIGISTNENDIVLDPFMGSGTTLVSAKELNRKYIGIEMDEKYFNMSKERIENETNK